MMMRAQALLQRNPPPTTARSGTQLEPNLCRCGTHMRICAPSGAPRELMHDGSARRASGGRAHDERPVLTAARLPRAGAARSSSASRSPASAQRRSRRRRRPSRSCPAALHDAPMLDSWIRIDADGAITVFTGKAELGQGITTALIQVAAEELDVEPDAIDARHRRHRPDPERRLHRRQPVDAGQRHRDPQRRRAGARAPARRGGAGARPPRRPSCGAESRRGGRARRASARATASSSPA